MSAEVLREAARLMRERASGATPGPWEHTYGGIYTGAKAERDAEHIASWHPAVALAVAAWLDACALVEEVAPTKTKANALTVARAYLGESA